MFKWSDEYSEEELDLIPIKNLSKPLGLDRLPWEFSRGAKTFRHYKKLKSDGSGETFSAIVVEYIYTYVKDSEGKTDYRTIKTYDENVYFYNEDGSLFYSIPVPASLNAKNIKEINRDMRQGRIDYLEYGAEELRDGAEQLRAYASTLPEPHKTNTETLAAQYDQVAESIDFIFEFYDVEIRHYIERITLQFETKILKDFEFDMTIEEILDATSETQPGLMLAYKIKQILSIPVRQPDEKFPNGLTVLTSMLHQLRKDTQI